MAYFMNGRSKLKSEKFEMDTNVRYTIADMKFLLYLIKLKLQSTGKQKLVFVWIISILVLFSTYSL